MYEQILDFGACIHHKIFNKNIEVTYLKQNKTKKQNFKIQFKKALLKCKVFIKEPREENVLQEEITGKVFLLPKQKLCKAILG